MTMEPNSQKGVPPSPALSVVVPAYNAAATLSACLEAIRRSSFRDYELIVVDDGSTDASASIARPFLDKVLSHETRRGALIARETGSQAASGAVLVNVDADVMIRPDTLRKINDHFLQNPGTDALVGLLSKECPHEGFFTQYKNLYMHDIFRKLPREITFLYGSIYACRRDLLLPYRALKHTVHVDDTEMGQYLVSQGKRILFAQDLEVTHLKQYSAASFFRNDFNVPFKWADIFLRYQGWKQLGRRSTGFAHSPKEQLASVVLAPAITILSLTAFACSASGYVAAVFFTSWCFLNARFLSFLTKERGLRFGLASFFITFLDNLTMASGIFCGLVASVVAAAHASFHRRTRTRNPLSLMLLNDKIRAAFFILLSHPVCARMVTRVLEALNAPMWLTGVRIELTNRCELNCAMCPHDSMTREKGEMGLFLFKKIIDQAARLHLPVYLSGYGEPLLYSHLEEVLRYMVEKRCVCRAVFTNGLLLDDARIEMIIKYATHIRIGIDTAREDVYRVLRKNDRYDKLRENIKNLIARSKGSGLKIQLELLRTRHNVGETAAGLRALFGEPGHVEYYEKDVQRVGPGSPDLKKATRPFDVRGCWFSYTLLNVGWNGLCSFCCFDYDMRQGIGHCATESLTEIWRGEKMRALRKQLIEGNFSELPLCKHCPGPL
jgi:glycosyltransferase involved in cell wall biosynthesis